MRVAEAVVTLVVKSCVICRWSSGSFEGQGAIVCSPRRCCLRSRVPAIVAGGARASSASRRIDITRFCLETTMSPKSTSAERTPS